LNSRQRNFAIFDEDRHALYSAPMPSRAPKIIAACVLIICIVCPILELFDSWDNTVQSGNDSEYAVVLVALCVAIAYWFARQVSKLWIKHYVFAGERLRPRIRFRSLIGLAWVMSLTTGGLSPPATPLRI
jgi:hypothetical protein